MTTSAPFIVVGKPVGQIEGVAKVSGKAVYSADVLLPRMLWGKVLRSPYPHARLLRINVSQAQALPGVQAVITGQDLPASLYGRRMRDMPVLARDRVRFVGEKVAVVAAETSAIAEEALGLIQVEYEELPAVYDPLEAMGPGAPRLHESVAAYTGHLEPVPDLANAFSHLTRARGDVEQGFQESDLVFEHTFTTPSQHHGYLEPHAVVVNIEKDGRVHIWLSSKTPFATRSQLAALLEVPLEQIVIHLSHIGGDFGGKGSVMDAPLGYYLAKATGRPIKIVMSYTEELTAGNPRHPSFITIRTGVKRDGRLWAWHARCVWNSGAYGAFLPAANLGGFNQAAGSYRVPNVRLESICVYTNCTPRGHMRAPGGPQVAFAVESHMNMIAEKMGIDPLEFRLMNVPQEGEGIAGGEPLRDVRAQETLRAAAQAAGWGKPKAAYHGRGLALYDRHVGSGQSSVVLSLNEEGQAALYTAAPDTGTGSHTILQQILAEELRLPLSQVRVVAADTDATTPDSGVGGSRVTHVAGQATLKAAREMRDRLAEAAAAALGVAPEQLQLDGGAFTVTKGPDGGPALGPRLSLLFIEAARHAITQAGGQLSVSSFYDGGSTAEVTCFCAQIAEVRVDPETGEVKVLKIVTAHDVGTILNPLGHQGQIEGGVLQGLGYATMEELLIEEGRVTNPHLGDYKIPVIQDIPELVTVLVEGPAGPAPYQGKAIGEVGNCPVAPAIANAVSDAVGVRITGLPVTAEKVYRALREQRGNVSV